VRANADVTVAVRPADRNRLALEYDVGGSTRRFSTPGEGDRTVRFVACPATEPSFAASRRFVGARTQFNGGFIPLKTGCSRIDAYVRGQPPITRNIGFATRGRSCG
jgi:hypothetical protein